MIRKVISETGKCLRETGQALDRLGCRAMGDHVSFRETWSRHRKLMNLYEKRPVVALDAFIAPNASIIGDVNIGDKTSVWYGAVIRGDVNKIKIGSMSNVQDRVVIHAAKPNSEGGFPTTTTVGDYVSIGHGAVLSSCVIENNVVIGPNALVLDGALVEKNSIIEPGTVVPPGRRYVFYFFIFLFFNIIDYLIFVLTSYILNSLVALLCFVFIEFLLGKFGLEIQLNIFVMLMMMKLQKLQKQPKHMSTLVINMQQNFCLMAQHILMKVRTWILMLWKPSECTDSFNVV